MRPESALLVGKTKHFFVVAIMKLLTPIPPPKRIKNIVYLFLVVPLEIIPIVI